jgi:hypothetical protein
MPKAKSKVDPGKPMKEGGKSYGHKRIGGRKTPRTNKMKGKGR